MTYSADFRNKVVQLYNSGTSTADLCAQFHISRSILYQWSEEAKVSNISKRDLATFQRHVATLENENSIYQKSLAALDLSIDNKVQIIDALKSEYSLYTLCRLLKLSKSTYINRQKSALIEKQLDVEDTLLKEKIAIIFQKSDYRFGAKKIRAKLMEQGYAVSTKRIVRLMKEHGLKRKQALPENATFQRHYTYRPNLVKQNFIVEKPNSIWVSDITYVKVNTSIAYVCVIIDLFSRKVVSHAVAEFADAELTIHTFKLAYQNRNHPQGLTFHSDQGAQYTAFSFRQLLLDFNVHQSFSDIGNPLDNAVAESFFASLKKEQFKFHFYETVSELEESLSEYIDFYNDYRPHECLKQQTPNQFEESYQQQK